MPKANEKKFVIAGLIITGFVLSVLAFTTEIPAGGADNYAHFNISRWAFRYPYLFLDHWGKPIFTIITAPIAQFGFTGLRIFNIVCGLFTAWFSYVIVRSFNLKFGWFAIVAVIFAPMYFVMMSSGMTEVLFSLVLVVSMYLFFKGKYILTAILISFLFLIRNEGVAFLLPFAIALFIKREYKAIPLLSSGFLLFSIIGGLFYYHDFLWLINKRPYLTGNATVYGSGNWDHFIVEMPNYLGYLISALLLTGSLVLIIKWLITKHRFNSEVFFQVLIILGCFWGYFFAHSYIWWRTENSAGLVRVMAAVSPLASIIAVFAINTLPKSNAWKHITTTLLILASLFLIVEGAIFYHNSITRDLSTEILKRTTKWLRESGSLNHKLVVHNPYFVFSTEIDPWDNNRVQYGFRNSNFPETDLPDSTIFIWDAQFSANEGKLSLEKIMENPNFELINYFDPEVPFKVLGNNDYKIRVFRKMADSGKNNRLILEQLREEDFKRKTYYFEKYDFENHFSDETLELRRLKKEGDSLNNCYSLKDAEFSHSFHIPENKIEKDVINKFRLTAEFYRREQINQNKLFMVFSAEKSDSSYYYSGIDINEQIPENNVWFKTEFIFNVPAKLDSGTIVKSYIWNIDKSDVLIDNFKLEIFKEEKE